MVFGFTKTVAPVPVGYTSGYSYAGPISSGVTATVPVQKVTLRQKLAARRALKKSTVVPVPVQTVTYTQPFGSTRKQFFGRKKTVAGTKVYKPTLFQKVKFFISKFIKRDKN